MNYLLDTNICIYIIKKRPLAVVKRIQSKRPEQIHISTITLAELEYGIERSNFADRNKIALLEFLFPFALIDFDQMAALEYGRIRLSLESMGTPIGPMDLLLAAQAKSRNLILVTNNEKEFKRIEGLETENWADERDRPSPDRKTDKKTRRKCESVSYESIIWRPDLTT